MTLAETVQTRADESGFYWCRHTAGQGQWNTRVGRREPEGPPGAELAALRRGLGREPGFVPGMWRFYTKTNESGTCTPEYAAEHAALTLFALHQQSQARPMHRLGVGLGNAVLALRRHTGRPAGTGQTTGEADEREHVDWSKTHPVDRRFAAAATATDLIELVAHLRGLVTQLRGIGQPLDYTQLFHDLRAWQYPQGATEVRRRWGMQYFTHTRYTGGDAEPGPSPDPAEEQ